MSSAGKIGCVAATSTATAAAEAASPGAHESARRYCICRLRRYNSAVCEGNLAPKLARRRRIPVTRGLACRLAPNGATGCDQSAAGLKDTQHDWQRAGACLAFTRSMADPVI